MLKLGVVGLGGYAGYVCHEAVQAAAEGDSIEFVAACDPYPEKLPAQRDELLKNGVSVLSNIPAFLKLGFDAVWLPVPIHLHRSFTEQAIAASKAVLVEKPAAGSVDDVDAMIALRDQSALPVAVGFQNLFDPNAWAVKTHLLAGRIGKIERASVYGCWPRADSYYARTGWAGRITRDGAWVLDSPLNNALSHFVNLALFLLGPAVADSAETAAVEAELFRTYSIEMFDTCNIRATLASGVPLMVSMTHACRQNVEPVVVLHGTKGSVRFVHATNSYEYLDSAGRVVETLSNSTGLIRQTIQSFARFMNGDPTAPVATLEHSRSHTVLVNAVSEAAHIVDVYDSQYETVIDAYGNRANVIPGIEKLLADCADHGLLLSETDSVALTPNVGRLEVRDYRHFRGLRSVTRPRDDRSRDVAALTASA